MSAAPDLAAPLTVWRAARTIFVFVGLGPLVGGGLVIGVLAIAMLATSGPRALDIKTIWVFVSVGLPASYRVGLLPAFFAGVTVAALRWRGFRTQSVGGALVGLAVAGLVVGVFAVYASLVSPSRIAPEDILFIFLFAAACVVSTIVCSRSTRKI